MTNLNHRKLCTSMCILNFKDLNLFSIIHRLSIIYAKFDEVARSGNMVVSEPNGRTCEYFFCLYILTACSKIEQ